MITLPGWTCAACHAFHGESKGSGEPREGGKVDRTHCRVCGSERDSKGYLLREELLVIVASVTRELAQAYENLTAAQRSATIAVEEARALRLKVEGLEAEACSWKLEYEALLHGHKKVRK